MNNIDVRQALAAKIKRQERLPDLQVDCGGNCVHIGRISPGCRGCFTDTITGSVRLGEGVGLTNACNKNCAHCFEARNVVDTYSVPPDWGLDQTDLAALISRFPAGGGRERWVLYNFSGPVEPLLYVPVIREYMAVFRNVIDPLVGRRGFAKIYTNGTLLTPDVSRDLRDLGFDEVRVNPSADGFSQLVYEHIAAAVRHIPIVTVEVPLWPTYRTRLMEMLPIIQDLGVKHLDLCQVEIHNREQLQRAALHCSDAEIFSAGTMAMLDDGGLSEDLFEQALASNCTYSVLDCNAFVKLVYAHENRFVKQVFGSEKVFADYPPCAQASRDVESMG